jgi:hypothetical protein
MAARRGQPLATAPVSATVNGVQTATGSTSWGGTCDQYGNFTLAPTLAQIASNLASSLAGSAAGVNATSSGTIIQISAKATGASTNYALSTSYAATLSSPFVSVSAPASHRRQKRCLRIWYRRSHGWRFPGIHDLRKRKHLQFHRFRSGHSTLGFWFSRDGTIERQHNHSNRSYNWDGVELFALGTGDVEHPVVLQPFV